MQSAVEIIALVILIAASFKKPYYSLLVYYTVRQVLPPSARIGNLSFITVSLLLILCINAGAFIKGYKRLIHSDLRYIRMVFWLFLVIMVLTFISSFVPKPYQWSQLLQFIGTEIVPSLCFLLLLKRKDYSCTLNTIALCAVFTGCYGIYTYVFHANPIGNYFNNTGLESRNLETYVNGRGGLESIAVGIYDDKIYCALVSLLLIMFLINKMEIKKFVLYPALILNFITLFLTTQRSPLLALIMGLGIFWFDKKNNPLRMHKGAIAILLCGCVFVGWNSGLGNIIMSVISIFDDAAQEKLGVGGSSMGMRFDQLANVILYIGWDLLYGAGYGFTSYYYSVIYDYETQGLDPTFYGFESFLLKILASSGILGLIAWGIYFYKNILLLAVGRIRSNLYAVAFCLSYIGAILMTDTSGSFFLYMILYVINKKSIDWENENSQFPNRLIKSVQQMRVLRYN